jgi:hypothetical protein
MRPAISAAVLSGVVKKRRAFCFLALTTTLLLSACASVPMSSRDADAAGKTFAPPPPGSATLYLYRESIFGAAYSLALSVGQRNLGALAADTWFRIDVEPRTYDIRCTTPEASDSRSIQIASGETRFVEAAIRMGFVAPRCAVFEVAPEKGRSAVVVGKRAQEIH